MFECFWLNQAEIIRPLRRVFDQTAMPVRELLLKTALSSVKEENILEDMKNEERPTDDALLSIDDDLSDILNPSVSNRESLSILNKREFFDNLDFERERVSVKHNQTNQQKQKENNVLVITAAIIKDDAKTVIEPSSVSASIIKESHNSSSSKFDSKQGTLAKKSIVDQLL